MLVQLRAAYWDAEAWGPLRPAGADVDATDAKANIKDK
jgi:hypothetical protein